MMTTLAASNNHRYPEGRDGDAVYLEPLIARLTEAGDAPVLRHEDRDTTAADLLKSVYRYARALAASGPAGPNRPRVTGPIPRDRPPAARRAWRSNRRDRHQPGWCVTPTGRGR